MFTRDELNSKSVKELQELALELGINPIGLPHVKDSWIVPLLAFSSMAINDCKNGLGLNIYPDIRVAIEIENLLQNIGEPTVAQKAAIKAAIRGRWMLEPENRAYQMRLWEIFQVRAALVAALNILR